MEGLELHPEKQLYMNQNLGPADCAIRIVLAALLVAMIMMNVIPAGAPALIAWLSSAAMILTSFMSYSPLYTLLGIDSRGKHETM
ncbi:MAG TPA: DUF2892 domain-containing protein [Flavitalea sp.]|nr:DUF2892 domain-containing protein [Flavitalea sp.]